MVLHLVRHACAGQKGEWIGPDEERPLDPAGLRQSSALASALAGEPVTLLVSSPTRRCVQTLEPLAATLELDVHLSPELLADGDPAALLALLSSPALDGAVLCTHGEVMRGLLQLLRDAGVVIAPPTATDDELLVKGTVWRLDVDPGRRGVLRVDHVRPSIEDECLHHRERSGSGSWGSAQRG